MLALSRYSTEDLFGEEKESTPLYKAVVAGNVEMCRAHLVHGDDPNCQDNECYETPLHAACVHGHLDICKLLLQFGANPDLKDGFGKDPLYHATQNGHADIVDFLTETHLLAGQIVFQIQNALIFLIGEKKVENIFTELARKFPKVPLCVFEKIVHEFQTLPSFQTLAFYVRACDGKLKS